MYILALKVPETGVQDHITRRHFLPSYLATGILHKELEVHIIPYSSK
jgi:hypothetical protein